MCFQDLPCGTGKPMGLSCHILLPMYVSLLTVAIIYDIAVKTSPLIKFRDVVK